MMIEVSQRFYKPKEKPQIANCSSIEDIINVPFVQRWMQDPNFYRICKSTTNSSYHLLIVETNRGNKHWYIADLKGDIDQLNLPEWKR